MHPALVVTACLVPGASPYHVDVVADGLATFGAFAVTALIEGAAKPSLSGGVTCAKLTPAGRCDPAELIALDRRVVGRHSQGWLRVSDVAAAVAYALPVALETADVVSAGGSAAEWGADLLVVAESVAVTTLVTQALKLAVRRPRPTQYREGAYVGSVEHQLSFPSGHTSSAAAATSAYAVTFALRHPDSPWRFAAMLGAVGVTAVAGYGRVGGGMHFYTDVIAGAVVGGTLGVLLPWLHRREIAVAPRADGSARGLVLALRF